jgi:hypothetical protein
MDNTHTFAEFVHPSAGATKAGAHLPPKFTTFPREIHVDLSTEEGRRTSSCAPAGMVSVSPNHSKKLCRSLSLPSTVGPCVMSCTQPPPTAAQTERKDQRDFGLIESSSSVAGVVYFWETFCKGSIEVRSWITLAPPGFWWPPVYHPVRGERGVVTNHVFLPLDVCAGDLQCPVRCEGERFLENVVGEVRVVRPFERNLKPRFDIFVVHHIQLPPTRTRIN